MTLNTSHRFVSILSAVFDRMQSGDDLFLGKALFHGLVLSREEFGKCPLLTFQVVQNLGDVSSGNGSLAQDNHNDHKTPFS